MCKLWIGKFCKKIINERTAAEAINKVKQNLATKEVEQRLKQEIERQQRNETLSAAFSQPETSDNLQIRSNCNTLIMETGKLFGIIMHEARTMSVITVGRHELTWNLSEPSDQTLMHIDVSAYFLHTKPTDSFKSTSSVTHERWWKDNRYTEVYEPHEVILNIDGINIYTKTMITWDEDLAGQIYVGREELRVRSIGHCAMLEEDAIHLGTEADVSAHVLDING